MIEVDQFQLKNWKRLLECQLKDQKSQLKDRIIQLEDRKSRFISKKSN